MKQFKNIYSHIIHALTHPSTSKYHQISYHMRHIICQIASAKSKTEQDFIPTDLNSCNARLTSANKPHTYMHTYIHTYTHTPTQRAARPSPGPASSVGPGPASSVGPVQLPPSAPDQLSPSAPVLLPPSARSCSLRLPRSSSLRQTRSCCLHRSGPAVASVTRIQTTPPPIGYCRLRLQLRCSRLHAPDETSTCHF